MRNRPRRVTHVPIDELLAALDAAPSAHEVLDPHTGQQRMERARSRLGGCGDHQEAADQPEPETRDEARAEREVDQLTGRTTAVALDAGFVDALTQLKLTPSPLGDATISDQGVASFPITGGNVTYSKPGTVSPFVQGEIDHDGSGLQLEGGGETVRLTDFVVDPGASVLTGTVTVDGREAAASAPLFFLDGRTLEPLKANSDGTAVLQGTTVKFKDESAQLLNDTFGVDALEGGLQVGTAKITINTRS